MTKHDEKINELYRNVISAAILLKQGDLNATLKLLLEIIGEIASFAFEVAGDKIERH